MSNRFYLLFILTILFTFLVSTLAQAGNSINCYGQGFVMQSYSYVVYNKSKNVYFVIGTSKSDIIVGSKDNDVICAGPGNDTITAFEGNDKIDGGTGRDKANGGGGKDSYRSIEKYVGGK